MKATLNSGNIVTLGTQDRITDNCWVLVEGSSFAERFTMQSYVINGGRMLPIISQTNNELQGVKVKI